MYSTKVCLGALFFIMHYIPQKQLFLLDLPLQLKPWNVDAARYIGWAILTKWDPYFSDVDFPVI